MTYRRQDLLNIVPFSGCDTGPRDEEVTHEILKRLTVLYQRGCKGISQDTGKYNIKDLQNVSKYELQKMKAHYLFNEIQFATCLLVLLQLDVDAVDHTADWSACVY